jgi:hypothetical protein
MYDYDLQTIFRDPRAVIVPGTRSHPEWRGRRLGEVLREPDGPAFLEYLANGGSAPFGLKLAAALVLAQERGWLAAVACPQDTGAQHAQQDRAKPKKTKAPDFWAILKLVETFSYRKSPLPILTRVLVRGWENWRVLAATDLEAWIKVLVRDDSPGRFSGAVAGYPEGTTGFVPTDRGISAVAHGMLHHRESLPAEKFPALPPKPKTLLGEVPAAELARALDQAANAASHDTSRPTLECVALYITRNNIEVRGSDGYHLYVAKVPWRATVEVGQIPDHLLIHRTAAEKMSKALSRLGGNFALGIVEKTENTNGYLYLGQERTHIWAALRPGKFPEVSDHIGTKVVGTVDWEEVQKVIRPYKTSRQGRVTLLFRVEAGVITAQPHSEGKFVADSAVVGRADPEVKWKFALDPIFLCYNFQGKVRLAALPEHMTPHAPVTFISEGETEVQVLVVMPKDIGCVQRWDLDLVTSFGEVLVRHEGNIVRYRVGEFLSDEDLQRILTEAVEAAEESTREELALAGVNADEILVPLRSKWRIQDARVYLDLEEDEPHWAVPSYISWVQVKFSLLLREAVYQALTQRLGPADA